MAIKIEVNSQEVINKSGMGNNQKAYNINEQIAWVHKGEAYPEKIKIRLQDGQHAYPNGVYELEDSSFYVGKFGSLEVSPRLKRIGELPSAQPRAATAVGK